MRRSFIRRIVALVLVFALIAPLCNIQLTLKARAATAPFVWEEAYTLTNKLELQNVETQAKDEEVVFSFDMLEDGTYRFTYNLDDKKEAVFQVDKQNALIDVYYSLYKYEGSPLTRTNITDDARVKDSYAVVKYNKATLDYAFDKETAPLMGRPVATTTQQAIGFKGILKGSRYPGGAFKIGNTTIRYAWKDKTFYFSTDGLKPGHVTPFTYRYNQPGAPVSVEYKKNVLTKIEGFESIPTQYYYGLDPATGMTTLLNQRVVDQNSKEKTGDLPGIDFKFKHPKVYNDTTKVYDYETTELPKDLSLAFYLDEYGTSGRDRPSTSFNLVLTGADNGAITGDVINNDAVNTGKVVKYDAATKEYTVSLIKEFPDETGVTVGALKNRLVRWKDLSASRIYETVIYSSPKRMVPVGSTNEEYEFTKYQPNGGYSYTYLDYILKRESIDDAYLEVIPYQGIKDDVLKYQVYRSYQSDYLDDDAEKKTELWLTYTHEISAENYAGKLYIPVQFTKTSSFYKIKIRFDGQISKKSLFTQLLKYRATDNEIVPPPVPKINSVSDIKVLPPASGNLSDDPSRITFDVTWDAPKESSLLDLLKSPNGELYYELMVSQGAKYDEGYKVLKVFKVSLDPATNKVKLTDVSGSSDGTDGLWDYEFGYNSKNNTFRMDDIIIKDADWAKLLEINKAAGNKSNEKIRDGEYGWTQGNDIRNELTDIDKLPNLNFLRMRAVYVRDKIGATGKEGTYSEVSFAKSLTLGYSTVDIPRPTQPEAKNYLTGDKTVRFDVTWNVIDITNFESYMLKPVGKSVEDVYYDVYLSKDKGKITNISPDKFTYIDLDASTQTPKLQLTADLVKKIRDGEVIALRIKGDKSENKGREKFYIEGGDSNQVYYFRVYANVKYDGKLHRSKGSEILSHTTFNYGDPVDDTIMPLTPENFEIKERISSSSIKLGWTRNMKATKPEETIGYEIIQVTDKELPAVYNNYTVIEDIVKAGTEYQGYRMMDVDGNGYKLYRYDTESSSWKPIVDRHSVIGDQATFIDDTLSPNKIYYYYVRAIRVTKNSATPIDANRPASGWASLTYTSAPLEKPINLTQDFTTYPYDEKYEAIVYFDVAIPEAGSGVDYIPEIYIYSEDDETYSGDYKLASVGSDPALPTTNGAPVGYKRFYKRITGLKSSRSYSVKVRIRTDEAKPEYSPFSKLITVRTEFDREDYERIILLRKYMRYYDLEVAKLYQQIFWILEEQKENYNVKFRESVAKDTMLSQASYTYDLDAKGYSNVVVYLPSELVDMFNEEGFDFRVNIGDMGVTLHQDTLDKVGITELSSFVDQVEKTASLKEYYIKMTLQVREYTNKVNGIKPISDYMRINMEVIGSNNYEENIEDDIAKKLEYYIRTNRIQVEKELIQALNNGIVSDEQLVALVDNRVEIVKQSHSGAAKLLFERATKMDFVSLYKLASPMTLSLKNAKNVAAALYRQNGDAWKQQKARSNSKEVYAQSEFIGEFIFAGYRTDELIDGEVRDGKYINDLLQKYAMTDLFTLTQLSDLKQECSKFSIYNSLARMLGAKEDQDGALYLKSLGVDAISSRRMYEGMTREEALYVMVQAFAIKGHMSLEGIRITDYYAITDLDKMNPKYQEMIQRGVALKAIPLSDGVIRPQDKMTVQEVLELLTRIEYRNW